MYFIQIKSIKMIEIRLNKENEIILALSSGFE